MLMYLDAWSPLGGRRRLDAGRIIRAHAGERDGAYSGVTPVLRTPRGIAGGRPMAEHPSERALITATRGAQCP